MALENDITNAQAAMNGWADNVDIARVHVERVKATIQELRPPTVVDVNDKVGPTAQALFASATQLFAASLNPLSAILEMFGPTLNLAPSAVTIDDVAEYLADNSLTVESRGVAYGTAADGGSNVGDQTLIVASKDANDDIIEDVTIETLTFECTGVPTTNAQKGSAQFSVDGEGNANRSGGDAEGTGFGSGTVEALMPGSNQYALRNASFDQGFVGSDEFKVPSWEFISGEDNAAADADEADIAFYRSASQNQSLLITGNCKLRFYFRDNNIPLSRLAPYIGGVFYKGAGASAATLTIRAGSRSAAGSDSTPYTASTTVNDTSGAFELLNLDPDVDDAWAEVFDAYSNPFFEIEISSYSSTVWIDDAFFKQMNNIGGRFMEIVSGTTPPVIGTDVHTHACTLTVNTAGKVVLDSGASGSVDSITVGGVELLRNAIPFNSTLADTAQDIVDEINDHENVTFPEYRAERDGAEVDIFQVVPVEGTIDVTSSATTISTTDTNLSGAQCGKLQDALIRHGLGYLPHATGGSWGN